MLGALSTGKHLGKAPPSLKRYRDLQPHRGLAVRSAMVGLCLKATAAISDDRASMQPPRRTEDTMERQLARVPIATVGDLPRDALLTAADVAEWLKIERRQVQRLGIPCIDLGRKTPRYQVKDVRAWLETRRRADGRRRGSSS